MNEKCELCGVSLTVGSTLRDKDIWSIKWCSTGCRDLYQRAQRWKMSDADIAGIWDE